jgi:phosphate transport system substrate-binding protein
LSLRGKIRTFAVLTAVVPTLALPAVAGATTLFGSGSSVAYPYMLKLFAAYHRLHHKVSFKYNPDGGNAGVKDVQGGRSQFAIQTRPPLPSDSGTTWDKLFVDGLCIAVNRSNSLSNISLSQVHDIFLGINTNWSQIAGSNLTTTIDPIGRNSAAGTYTFFQQAVLGGKTQSSNVAQKLSDGQVQVAVQTDPNAIGYVGVAHTHGIKPLTIGGEPCDRSAIAYGATHATGGYPLWRYIWSVLPSNRANRNVEKFLDWVRTSKQAGQILNRAGAVAAFNKH